MLGQMEFGPNLRVALETSFWIPAGVEDELFAAGPADGDVFAGRAVAGFAPALAGHLGAFRVQSRMRAAWEGARNICVTVQTDLVTNKRSTFNLRWRNHHLVHGGTGIEQQNKCDSAGNQPKAGQESRHIQFGLTHEIHIGNVDSIRQ